MEIKDSKVETLNKMIDMSRKLHITLDEHLKIQNDLIAAICIVEEYLKQKESKPVHQEGG